MKKMGKDKSIFDLLIGNLQPKHREYLELCRKVNRNEESLKAAIGLGYVMGYLSVKFDDIAKSLEDLHKENQDFIKEFYRREREIKKQYPL